MEAYDFVLLALHASKGRIEGRTLLQKTVYFLGVMTDHVEELGYRAHYYGPYSDEVTIAVRALEGLCFVESQRTIFGVDRDGFEMTRTDYRLTEDGRQIAEMKREKCPDFWQELQKAAKLIRKGQERGYVFLSIAAKTYFMLDRQEGPVSHKRLAQLAADFGWKVSEQQVTEAARYLESLDLVELGAA